ncbi:MAG: hypothetical protein JO125_08725 [Chloroflexi bacterium]|nr:hypothetical protein [Ktedonobacteraceae bacterium]MBV9707475.1 hypothetical protein [Chloroflexota bacterium]
MSENLKENEPKIVFNRTAVVRNNQICCMESTQGDCSNATLLKAQISSFHDEQLAEVTNRINQILDEMKKHNQDPKRELALISVGDRGVLLAWVTPAVSQFSGLEEFSRALGIE